MFQDIFWTPSFFCNSLTLGMNCDRTCQKAYDMWRDQVVKEGCNFACLKLCENYSQMQMQHGRRCMLPIQFSQSRSCKIWGNKLGANWLKLVALLVTLNYVVTCWNGGFAKFRHKFIVRIWSSKFVVKS